MIWKGVSSTEVDCWSHTRTSMLSVVGVGSCLENHGGLLKEQQVLVDPHPCMAIKKWITSKKLSIWAAATIVSSFTEVVIANKCGWIRWCYSSIGAWTKHVTLGSIRFGRGSSKRPDMLAWRAMCDTYSIYVITVYWLSLDHTAVKRIWMTNLVRNNSPTDATVPCSIDAKCSRVTACGELSFVRMFSLGSSILWKYPGIADWCWSCWCIQFESTLHCHSTGTH